MKAAQISKYGGVEVIEINENAPDPSLKPGQILAEVYAASLNPFDSFIRGGYLKEKVPLELPVTLGGDFAGIVTKVGQDVANFKVGDEVYGAALVVAGGSGSLAEFVAGNTANLAQKPKNIDFVEAASLPLVGASAIQALEEHINLKQGQKILIHGGSGGIGSIAIQLAKAIGAYVAATVSTKDVGFAKSLGADEVIDFKVEDFEKIVKDFDAVFVTGGADVVDKSFKVLKRGGTIVSMLGAPSADLAKKYGINAIGQVTGTSSERLGTLAKYVEEGKIKPQIDKVFPLEEAKEAFKHLEEGHPRGKVVLKIK